MPRTAFEKLPEARRSALLDVAARHFAAHGFKGASLNAILGEAGVSKGVAYYYFDDKSDLLATVMESSWAEIAPVLPPEDPEPWPAMYRLYRARLEVLRARPWLAELARQPIPPEIEARLLPLVTTLATRWSSALRRGLVRRDLPADLVMSMLQGLSTAIDTWWVANPDATDAEADAAFAALRALVQG
jgi:AcrR family transcriptional regulator